MVSWYLSTLKNALDEKHLVTHNMHSLRHDFPRFSYFLGAENSRILIMHFLILP